MKILKYIFNRKYRIFSKKIKAVQDSIWDLDFKVAKAGQVREGIRQDRDRAIESLQKIEPVLNAEKNKVKKIELEKEKALYAENVKRYEAQMRMVDEQIQGKAAQGEDPGVEGINDRIRMLAELREMYRSYLRQI